MKSKFPIFILVGFFTLLTMISPIMAHTEDNEFGHHSMMGGYWGINPINMFMGIFMILVIIAFLFWAVQQKQQPTKKT